MDLLVIDIRVLPTYRHINVEVGRLTNLDEFQSCWIAVICQPNTVGRLPEGGTNSGAAALNMMTTMRGGALLLAVLAVVVGVTHGLTFPYVKCAKRPSAYSLAPTIRRPDNNTFCFTVKVAVPDNCTNYCCAKADLRKILIDINPECNVKNPGLIATINGHPTAIGPGFEPGLDGPEDAYLLRLTQLGLNLTNANNTEICVTLGLNPAGNGCDTVEQFCRPPPGAPAGTCTAALFDVKNDCCPVKSFPEYAAPPSPSAPSAPFAPLVPGLAPALQPCTTCATLNLEQVMPGAFYNRSFTPAECKKWSEMVVADLTAEAAAVGATLLDEPPSITCTDNKLQVCNRFATAEEGAKMENSIHDLLRYWYGTMADPCKAYNRGAYKISGQVSNGVDDTGCLNSMVAVSCDPPLADFPKCKCDTIAGATPFYALPYLEQAPGRTNSTTLYCFQLIVREPWDPESACGKTTTLLKAEVYADDTRRRRIRGLAIKSAKAAVPRFVSPSWSSSGENTLKFSSLNWSLEEAHGAKLCMEIDNAFGVGPFCFGGSTETCKIIFFDTSRDCCPMFDAST
ncbi:hypothetical protein PLESTB_000046700 [Pleodorina starrii]|uniref:Pherophorin domain-containing protein n=1 Tax=Pleodorina starrii TaxID=330485 RepID=A0A9W6EXF9_9CHLO|nr:hypothetical protein PLESTM_001085900 [Pleodorina starrii]GLC47986.1 hypothetical protein PLESTB_000046700 [Pleodorina starrii]GLC70577.1 hypothetical protein PLESTF_001010500 [Pleodorina starrii]